MTESFQAVLFAVLAVITTLFALIGLIVSLSSEQLRKGIPTMLVCAGIGFFAALLSFGGGSSDFQQLAMIIGLLFAILAACAGFLLGLGGYCVTHERKFLGILTVIASLLLPSWLIYARYIQPKLIANDQAWWQAAFKNGVTTEKEKEAANHLSPATKEQFIRGLGYAAPGSIQPSAIILLYQNGIRLDAYVPFPPELARELISHPPPYSAAFVSNPSLPPDVLEKLSTSHDTSFFEALGRNPSLPNDAAEKLFSRCENIIATPDDKSVSYSHPNVEKANAGGCLFSMTANPGMPADIMEKLCVTDDANLLRRLLANPALAPSAAEYLRQKFESMLAIAQGPPSNSGGATRADFGQYGLRVLAANPGVGAEVMEKLSNSDDLELLQDLASNPALPESVAEKLIAKFNAIISAPKKQLTQFQTDEEYAGLAALAKNTHLPSNILDELSSYDNPGLLRRLAENPSLSDQTAQSLQLKFQTIGAIASNAPASSDRVGILDEVRMGMDALAKRNK